MPVRDSVFEFPRCLRVAARETTSCPPSFVFLVPIPFAIRFGMSKPEELSCELVLEYNNDLNDMAEPDGTALVTVPSTVPVRKPSEQ